MADASNRSARRQQRSVRQQQNQPQQWQTEASQQVDHLRERGVLVYNRAKSNRDPEALQVALALFRRAATHASPNVAHKLRASACKNVLACHKILLEWSLDSNSASVIKVDSAFHDAVAEATAAYTTAANNSFAHSKLWLEGLRKSFVTHMANVASAAALDDGPHTKPAARARYRIAALNRILTCILPSAPHAVRHEIHFKAADVILKASVSALEANDFVEAVSIIGEADYQILCMDDEARHADESCEALLRISDEVDALLEQIFYQRCAAESAQKISLGLTALRDVVDDDVECSMDADVLGVIDLFKEAQVLAREKSLEKEAEACARLGSIYHNFTCVRDANKEELYYNNAFNLVQSMGAQAFVNFDWAKDTRLARERLQREQARLADKRKEPVLEKHKNLLHTLRHKLGIFDKEKEGLLLLYEKYPPKKGEVPKKKLEDGDLKGAIKATLLHFHPDRNLESVYGFEHSVICEEITKLVNLMYARRFKGND